MVSEITVGSRIRSKPIPDPGSRGKKGTGSRIRIRCWLSQVIKHVVWSVVSSRSQCGRPSSCRRSRSRKRRPSPPGVWTPPSFRSSRQEASTPPSPTFWVGFTSKLCCGSEPVLIWIRFTWSLRMRLWLFRSFRNPDLFCFVVILIRLWFVKFFWFMAKKKSTLRT